MKFSHFISLILLMSSCQIYALPEIKINFIFATAEPNAQIYNRKSQMHKEVAILNRHFRSTDGKAIFNFIANKFISLDEFQKRQCELEQDLKQSRAINPVHIKPVFNRCFHPQKNTVNIVVFDAYHAKNGWEDETSWGFRNGKNPFILLDWKRLNYRNQAALPHEMGHVFGLAHICEPHAKRQDATNLMASAGGCTGSGGKRSLGLNSTQIHTIMKTYQQFQ